MASEVKRCACKHEGQDNLYGKGNRLMNEYNKGYRCTVCGKELVENTGKKQNYSDNGVMVSTRIKYLRYLQS